MRQQMREFAHVRYGSMKGLYTLLDANQDGAVSAKDFVGSVKALGFPVNEVTACAVFKSVVGSPRKRSPQQHSDVSKRRPDALSYPQFCQIFNLKFGFGHPGPGQCHPNHHQDHPNLLVVIR